MATGADDLRAALRARIEDEQLADPRVKALERWALQKPDNQVAEAIELLMIGLNASRKGRWVVLRTIDDELRHPDDLLPHDERVTLLHWIVRSRETDARIRAKLVEIRDARGPKARTRIIDALTAFEGPNAVSIENAHAILAHAWRAAPPEARPTGVVHRGEPEPVIGPKNAVRLTIGFARRVAHLVPRPQKKAFERLLELAVTAVAAGRTSAPMTEALEDAPAAGAIGIARSACFEARATLTRPDMVGIAARPAAVKVVTLLLEAHGPDAVRAFLSDLDDELRRLDVVHALEVRKKTSSRPIARAILRGAEDGEVVLWLAELDDGRLGLLARAARAWAWHEGSRDEILATVPDAHFESAVMAKTVVAI